jgi:hypothetical protein
VALRRAGAEFVGRSPAGLRDRGVRSPRARLAVTDEEVLAAVVELSRRYRAPSTSLVTWQLGLRGGTAGGAFQSTVRDALHRLQASGRLACVEHRGTHHWTAVGRDEQRRG